MTETKAPYVRLIRRSGGVVWKFDRKDHRSDLPAWMVEPWYSAEYVQALLASGLRKGQAARVIQELPYSLSRGILQYRLSQSFRASSHDARGAFDLVAERLDRRYGWVDLRRLNSESAEAMVQASRDAPAARWALRKVFAHAVGSGTIAENPLPRCPQGIQTRTRCERAPTVQWTEDDLRRFTSAVPEGQPERIALFLVIHRQCSRPELTKIGSERFRDAGALHPELLREIGPHLRKAQPLLRHPAGRQYTVHELGRHLRVATEKRGVPPIQCKSLSALHIERFTDLIASASRAQ
ncbi:hypothetical protein [Tranquillimonas rosea]|uniref:hypothetical protein n=1 Tax=Tranquillimonas rosea TaxID=641238 RepID=UPI003BAD8F37